MFKYVSLWGAFLAQTPHPTWEMTSLDLRGWSPRHYLPVVYTLFRPRATGTELRTAGEGLAGISGEGPDPPPLILLRQNSRRPDLRDPCGWSQLLW